MGQDPPEVEEPFVGDVVEQAESGNEYGGGGGAQGSGSNEQGGSYEPVDLTTSANADSAGEIGDVDAMGNPVTPIELPDLDTPQGAEPVGTLDPLGNPVDRTDITPDSVAATAAELGVTAHDIYEALEAWGGEGMPPTPWLLDRKIIRRAAGLPDPDGGA